MTRSEALIMMSRLIDTFDQCAVNLKLGADGKFYLVVTGLFREFTIITQPRCFTKPPFAEKIDGLSSNHSGSRMLFTADARGVDELFAKLKADYQTLCQGVQRS